MIFWNLTKKPVFCSSKEASDVYYSSQFFSFTKKNIKKKPQHESFVRTDLGGLKNLHSDFVRFDMNYEKFKEFCRETRKNKVYDYLYFHRYRKKKRKFFFRKETISEKNLECVRETDSF